jgi:hypothetical protein
MCNDYQITTMPTATFEAAVRQLRRSTVPRFGTDTFYVMYRDVDGDVDAFERFSDHDMFGVARRCERYIGTYKDYPCTISS